MSTRITRNGNITRMRLRDNTDNTIRDFFEEHFWIPEQWPDHIVNCLIDFRYTDRICMCNFFFGNGIQFEDAFRIITFYHDWNQSTTTSYRNVFRALWTRIESAVNRLHENWQHIISTYYFYSMIVRAVLFFNGNLRLYGVSINVQQNNNISREINVPHTQYERREGLRFNNREIIDDYQQRREREARLNRRWQFLASIDGDPVVIDGVVFRFDWSLYTNVID